MNFLSKGFAKGAFGVGGRGFLQAAVLATFASPMTGCAAEIGGSAEEAAEVEAVDSTSQASTILSVVNSAALLGCTHGRAALKSANGAYYVTAQQTDGAMVCDRTVEGSWEVFDVYEVTYATGAKRVAFKSYVGSGPYVSATDGGGSSIYANRSGIGDWESFGVVSLSTTSGPGKALQANSGHFLTREGNGGPGCVLNANRPSIGTWETFRVQCF
jgi:hypothetical protein